ncbi:MAG: energy-coupling factor transporter transmembrane protein EcfT [Acidimicrobiia bacterium]|nr:energy-coupling factor transporter transmembrane protein EcfT [Acidimicrobiia bacterium]
MTTTVGSTTVDSALHRIDPTVKMAVLLVVSLVLLGVFDPYTPTALLVLALVLAIAWGGVRPRTLVIGLIPFLSFGFSLLAVNAVTRPGTDVFGFGPVTVTSQGVAIGASLAIRTLVIGVGVIALMRSTNPERLVASLHQYARLPARAAYALLVAYRILDDLPAEWTTIRRAHALRTGLRADGGLPRSPRALSRAALGLLVETIRRAGEMSIALETRALGPGPRTLWRPSTLDRRDLMFAIAVLGGVVATLWASHLMGTLRGPSVL